MYDRPIDMAQVENVTIKLTIPANSSAYLIDDLKFDRATKNTIEIFLEENSTMFYQFFVANHQLCNLCERKKVYDCQKLPAIFEKRVSVILEQPGGQAYVKCHYLGDNKSIFKLNTEQRHKASNTTSTLIVKSVLDDESKFVADSTTYVEKNITDVVAEQMNRNLLLNDKAHVISTPNLDINTNEASCKHGTTISSLSEQDLFYLASRGLNKETSIKTLVEAFLSL
jgi:hypothetical protein